MTQQTYPAPAKLNLFLHITGQREDGYHLLHAARGTFAAECGEIAAAIAHFRQALAKAIVSSEREFLEGQLRRLED